MIKRLLALVLIASALLLVTAPGQTFAAKDILKGDPDAPLCDSGGTGGSTDPNSSAVCTDRTKDNPLTGKDGVLVKITNIVAYVAGGAAIIVVLVGSIRYITSGGDAGKVSSAKSAVINAFIGLVVIIFAKILIVYIVQKL